MEKCNVDPRRGRGTQDRRNMRRSARKKKLSTRAQRGSNGSKAGHHGTAVGIGLGRRAGEDEFKSFPGDATDSVHRGRKRLRGRLGVGDVRLLGFTR